MGAQRMLRVCSDGHKKSGTLFSVPLISLSSYFRPAVIMAIV